MLNEEQRRLALRASPALVTGEGRQRAARAKVARGPKKEAEAAPSTAPRTTAGHEIGKWSESLFLEYKAAKEGPRKRFLLNQLVLTNMPLAKVIVDQLCGRGTSTRRGFGTLGGLTGARDLDWSDSLQAGLLALTKAIEQFDPSKGKISSYLRLKCRHELQRLIYYGGQLVRTPRGTGVAEIPVALIGEEQTLDLMSGSGGDEALSRRQAAQNLSAVGVSVEDVERWEETGELSEAALAYRERAMSDAREEQAKAPRAPASPPRIDRSNPVESYLELACVFATHARYPKGLIATDFEVRCRAEGVPAMGRDDFYAQLASHGRTRETRMRWGGRPVRALAGVRLRAVPRPIPPASTSARLLHDYDCNYAEVLKAWQSRPEAMLASWQAST